MWLISNPLFEIGAGLVLIAATVWMLLNAAAHRPAPMAPAVSARPPPPLPPVAEVVPSLGPLSVRSARGMYLADETELAEPPLRLAPAPPAPATPPPLERRLPDLPPEPIPEPAAVAALTGVAEPIGPPAAEPVQDVAASDTQAEAVSVIEPSEPELIRSPPVEAPDEAAGPPAEELEPPALASQETDAPQPALMEPASELAEIAPPPPGSPAEPAGNIEPPPAAPVPPLTEAAVAFEDRLQAWLQGLLQVPGAPPLATVSTASTRVKRGVDPTWPEAARDLRAALETLGKLAPSVFAAPGARGDTLALAEAAGAPLALVWPEVGAAFDPDRHEARSGEGDAVAAVIRPGMAYGESVLPALVIRGSGSSNSASA